MIDNTGMTSFEKKVDIIDLCNEKPLPDAKPGCILFSNLLVNACYNRNPASFGCQLGRSVSHTVCI